MSNKSNILSSLTSLLKDLGNTSRNVLISLGSDSNLSNFSFYDNLLSRVPNKLPSVLIFFCDLEDFPPSISERFSGNIYLKYRDESKDNFKDDIFEIYLVPYNLPNLSDFERDSFSNLSDLLFFLSNDRVSISETSDNLRVIYNGVSLDYDRIDLSVSVDSFSSKDFMILLTQYCLSMISHGGEIFLLNRYSFNTRGWFGSGREAKPINGVGNKYLSRVIYFYPFISLLKESKKLSLILERNENNYLSNFVKSVNIVSSPSFSDLNLNYLKKDWKDMIPYSMDSVPSMINFNLERQILTSDGSSIIQIPSNSFSTAFGSEWLNSYAVIVGINNVLTRFAGMDLNKIVVCIPEIQYDILQDRWNLLRGFFLLRDCKLLFMPINVSGLHWTLLMINFESGFGYHIDSLPKEIHNFNKDDNFNKQENLKKDDKFKKEDKFTKEDKSNYDISNKICNKILNRDVINIYLDDQKNGYDCGAFILLHLYYLINGYVHDKNILEYLEDKVRDVNVDLEIKKIRENIYKLSDILSSSVDERKNKSKKRGGMKRRPKLRRRSLKKRRRYCFKSKTK